MLDPYTGNRYNRLSSTRIILSRPAGPVGVGFCRRPGFQKGGAAVSERAHDLADRFEQANEELIAFARGLSETQWRTLCPREGRTVGAVVYHIAEGHALTTEVARSIALGGRSQRGWFRAMRRRTSRTPVRRRSTPGAPGRRRWSCCGRTGPQPFGWCVG